ncbi:hypothetical protein SAMD00023353_4500310 [Rosellinia necatrix]|uniref:Uncharacterized protein n=1 Tax=Rosellinia necatrix TaxID=77044 RepID=A0A1S8A9B4_ROSNE|nr:hypothetical protein SAMD00023353_4500310 [Rosellinia necatrix]
MPFLREMRAAAVFQIGRGPEHRRPLGCQGWPIADRPPPTTNDLHLTTIIVAFLVYHEGATQVARARQSNRAAG